MDSTPLPPPVDPSVLAALDIGSNSVRLSVVRLDEAAQNWTTLAQYKETVRLGQNEFERHLLTEDAIARGITALKTFGEIARGYGASEVVAIGTAALREAENRDEFLARAASEAKIQVRVVSGIEEARLIYLGVVSGLEMGERRGLFIDIGGGSTELIIGTGSGHSMLDSLKLGAIRVANQFLRGLTGPVAPTLFAEMQQHVRLTAAHALRHIRDSGFDIAIASSGTATNLAKIAMMRAGIEPAHLTEFVLTTDELGTIARQLCRMTQEERRAVPGLNPERADIIVAGAAVLLTLAEEASVPGFRIADRSLREGVIVDALLRRGGEKAGFEAGARRRSVERLARLMEGELPHARHVVFLTLRIFDELCRVGLMDYGQRERELLEYAALLHDIGIFVARSAHHRHSYYIIRHAEMAGFTDEEVQIIANLAYFHRKSAPKRRHEHFQTLSRENQKLVRRLSILLRLAEGLDRSHLGRVKGLTVTVAGRRLWLDLTTDGNPHLEIGFVAEVESLFPEEFGLPLEVRV
ncbi:MAG: Ppx/GppA phosphatase family protein [Capsulimonadales bacterium]|nr:Ppx/GppA phosphatase family protein [Capsulimonadales bacterium]